MRKFIPSNPSTRDMRPAGPAYIAPQPLSPRQLRNVAFKRSPLRLAWPAPSTLEHVACALLVFLVLI